MPTTSAYHALAAGTAPGTPEMAATLTLREPDPGYGSEPDPASRSEATGAATGEQPTKGDAPTKLLDLVRLACRLRRYSCGTA